MRPHGRPLLPYGFSPAVRDEVAAGLSQLYSSWIKPIMAKTKKSEKTPKEEPKLNPLLAKIAKKQAAAFKAAKKRAMEEGGITDYDDGIYEMTFNGFEIQESKSSGRVQLAVEWKFAEGQEYAGKTTRRFYGLEDEKTIYWLNNDLIKLGYEPVDITTVESTMKEIDEARPKCRVSISTSGDFQNIRIKKVLEESTTGAGGDEDEAGEDEIDLDELDKEELLALIEEREIEIEGKPKKMKEKELRAAIAAALAAGGEDEEEEEEDEEESEEEEEESEDEEEEEEEEEKPKDKKKGDKKKKEEEEEEEEDEEDEEESEEEEDEDEEEEEVTVDKGDVVRFVHEGKKVKGEVTKVKSADGTCTVKLSKSGKLIKGVALDDVEVLEE